MIILLDDDPSMLVALEVMSDELGFEYKSFDLADKALEYLTAQNLKKISLIICDYKLPGMNGIEFIKNVSQKNDSIPFILITAHDAPDIAMQALEEGAYDYIAKPINFKELAILSNRAIKQKEIKDENQELTKKIKNIENPKISFIGKSKSIQNIKEMIKKVAKTNANILITGETGTGKEIIAKKIYERGSRLDTEMVTINCASIPESLLESELFGHVKGAFTGADKDKTGLFEQADQGVIFLDEIGDMPLGLQAKLLRVLQEGKFRKVGGNKEISVDVRVIAATHNNLYEKIKTKEFREDLFYRLNVINIVMPPLRERSEDIPLLIDYFLKKYNSTQYIQQISTRAMSMMMNYDWPGNIRELENTIERACILTNDRIIDENYLIINNDLKNINWIQSDDDELKSLQEIEKEYITFVLNETGNIKDKAANILGINRKTLYRKIKEYEIE